MKWEYRIIKLSKSDSDELQETFLNAYGVSGWEVVEVLSEDKIFLRILLKRITDDTRRIHQGFIYQNQFGKMMILDWPTPWMFASVKGLRIKKGERWVEVKGLEIIPKDVNQEFWGEHIYVRPNHP